MLMSKDCELRRDFLANNSTLISNADEQRLRITYRFFANKSLLITYNYRLKQLQVSYSNVIQDFVRTLLRHQLQPMYIVWGNH